MDSVLGALSLRLDMLMNDLTPRGSQTGHLLAMRRILQQAAALNETRYLKSGDSVTASTCDLSRVVRQAIELSRGDRGPHERRVEAGTRFVLRISPLPPVLVPSPALTRVFANLFRNAVQAMRGKGCIRVTAAHRGDFLAVRVRDDGPGVPPKLRSRVFKPGFTTKADGSGLGLAIVHDVLRQAGGRARLLLNVAPGACFELLLPCAEPPDCAAVRAVASSPPAVRCGDLPGGRFRYGAGVESSRRAAMVGKQEAGRSGAEMVAVAGPSELIAASQRFVRGRRAGR